MILIGTSGYSFPDWVGNFYPLHIERSHLLEQIRSSEALSDADKAAILGGTARAVLGLD